jgi:hypothetical protein
MPSDALLIDALLIDVFGVIARPQSASGWAEPVALAGVPGLRDSCRKRRHAYDRGDMTGAGYWRRVTQDLGTAFRWCCRAGGAGRRGRAA